MKSVLTSGSIFAISLLSSFSFYEKGLAYRTLLRQDRNNGIHLAVSPVCGPLSGNVSDVNAGIDLKTIKTIVAFGDSYTDGGREDGGPLAPPVVIPPEALAGGRSTDGKVWVENIADDIGATLMDYAQSGACTDLSLWPSAIKQADFVGQVKTFLNQSNDLDPETTLYTVFFGINDYGDSMTDGTANLQAAAQVIIDQIRILTSPPTNARAVLVTDVYGRGTHTPAGDAFVQSVFAGLHALRANATSTSMHSEDEEGKGTGALRVAFAEFARIWDGVLGAAPGYEAFGYVSTDACIVDCSLTECTTEGMCDDPEHYFYYIDGHPSKEGHRIMADYVEEVLRRCVEADA
ncbi:hypothetical protein TRAPUB_4680 [Trametes pubescens]|uniref:Carbohydrate esterase family 16 protein n=1 Tax=Trametes pubescens TaxID=154538 RepID=A0A1M2VAP0_TRAPU|nr:hypothetical protein TRAPUB_4680 [Trametes pubescens]